MQLLLWKSCIISHFRKFSVSLPPLPIQNGIQVFLYSHLFSKAGVVVSEDSIRVAFDWSLVFWDAVVQDSKEKGTKGFLTRNDKCAKVPNFLQSDLKEFQHSLVFYHKRTKRKIHLSLRMGSKEKSNIFCYLPGVT